MRLIIVVILKDDELFSMHNATHKLTDNNFNGYLLLLVLYIILKPFYLFPSGGLQIADIILIVLFILLIIGQPGLKVCNSEITLFMLGLCIIVTAISGFWAISISDTQMIKPVLFFTFNLILFFIVSHLINHYPQTLKYILGGVIASAFIQLTLLPISFSGTVRQTLFFNNPNQLGYWSIASACIFLYLVQNVKIPKILYCLFTVIILILAGLSLSKAATISILLLYFLYYGNRPLVGMLFITGLLIAVSFAGEIEQISNVLSRLSSIGSDSDDNFSGRGYDRIWLAADYIWFGNGEGGYDRFYRLKGAMSNNELHSTMAMLFFSYGPTGLFVFLAIFIRLFITKGIPPVLPFIPLLAYGVTHQGFRFSFFWLLLAIVSSDFAVNRSRKKQHN